MTTSSGMWPPLAPMHPLVIFSKKLPGILERTSHDEVWGVRLSVPSELSNNLTEKVEATEFVTASHLPSIPVLNVLQKYLRANQNDVLKAAVQLENTLIWRKEFNPRAAASTEQFDQDIFGGLGYITVSKAKDEQESTIIWNIYGAVKDKQKTFGDVDNFLRWRIGLMERSLATTPIPDYSAITPTVDPYQCIQVHDYLNVSFLRMDPQVKIASKAIIALMTAHYPELLSRKFFVNVPVVMQWMFTAIKLVLSKETVAKFTVVGYGNQLVHELGDNIPTEYGGKGASLTHYPEKNNMQ